MNFLMKYPYQTTDGTCPSVAILGWISNLEDIKLKLKTKYKLQNEWTIGKDYLFTQINGWKFYMSYKKVSKRIQDIFQFGFLDKFTWYENMTRWYTNRNKLMIQRNLSQSDMGGGELKVVTGIKLDTNLKSIFLYFLFSNLSLFLVVLVEIIRYNITYIWDVMLIALRGSYQFIFKHISSTRLFITRLLSKDLFCIKSGCMYNRRR